MSTPSDAAHDSRLPVQRTCKLYIGGKFPRTESGRSYSPAPAGTPLGNICQASRKDFRNAVVAARKAASGWSARTPYNRGQILYRIAEMLEGRRQPLIEEAQWQGLATEAAVAQTHAAIDCLIHYAGWCDKFQQVFSTVNPVSSPHYNFSTLEPVGVVGLLAATDSPLLGLVSLLAPILAGGNTVVVLASETMPLSAITLGEVLDTSDVPPGVVNILTGLRSELAEQFASHMDVNSLAVDGGEPDLLRELEILATDNMKRMRTYAVDWSDPDTRSPYLIEDFCELKTTWHPIEQIGPGGSAY